MIGDGIHRSMTVPSKNKMLSHCGKASNVKLLSVKEVMANVVHQLASTIVAPSTGRYTNQIYSRSRTSDSELMSENECKDECDTIL